MKGTREQAIALWDEVSQVLARLGLRLSEEKTRVCRLDEGFDFLGFRIQRRRKKGTDTWTVYTYPSKKALLSAMRKARALTNRVKQASLETLLKQLNPILRYSEDGASTSGTGCPKQHSDTWTCSHGDVSPRG